MTSVLDRTGLSGFELSINSKMSMSANHGVVNARQEGTKWQVVDKPYGRAGLAAAVGEER